VDKEKDVKKEGEKERSKEAETMNETKQIPVPAPADCCLQGPNI
jgi:hypothetical protein